MNLLWFCFASHYRALCWLGLVLESTKHRTQPQYIWENQLVTLNHVEPHSDSLAETRVWSPFPFLGKSGESYSVFGNTMLFKLVWLVLLFLHLPFPQKCKVWEAGGTFWSLLSVWMTRGLGGLNVLNRQRCTPCIHVYGSETLSSNH